VAVGIVSVVVVRNVFVEAHRIIGWATASIVVAVLLAPAIERLDRLLPRALALVLTFVGVIAVGIGILALFTAGLRAEVDRLVQRAPEIAADIEARGDRVGTAASELQLADRVAELTERLDNAVGSSSDTIRSAALSAPAYFVSMILTVFFLVYGRRIVEGGLNQLEGAQRERFRRSLHRGVRRSQRYIWAALGEGAVAGVLIGLIALVLNVPAPAVLGLFAAIVALIPYLGLFLGALPVLLLGLGVAPGWQVGVAALMVTALMVANATWWRPMVDRASLYVGPAIPLVVGILGWSVYGIGGALYAMALSVFALAVIDELDPGDRLPTPTDDYDGDGDDGAVGGGDDDDEDEAADEPAGPRTVRTS
jgi:predicted PurR-regulated permease PerM